ncbi:MAG: HD domain-containing protein [Armatimonadota bacterium]
MLARLDCGARLVRMAYLWAARHHAGQVRKDGSAVFDHVRGVAGNVIEAGSCDPHVVAAALLHDLLEATGVTAEEVLERFGPRVAALVEAMTNRPGEDARASAQRAVEVGPDAVMLRLCDRLDGLRRVGGRSAASRRDFLSSARAVHLPLAERHFPVMAESLREAIEAAEAALGCPG